jgi:hypothetical protein
VRLGRHRGGATRARGFRRGYSQQIVCSASSVTCPVGVGCFMGGPHIAFDGSPVSKFEVYTGLVALLGWQEPSGVRTNAGFPLQPGEL